MRETCRFKKKGNTFFNKCHAVDCEEVLQESQRRGKEKAIRAFDWIQLVNILVLKW